MKNLKNLVDVLYTLTPEERDVVNKVVKYDESLPQLIQSL